MPKFNFVINVANENRIENLSLLLFRSDKSGGILKYFINIYFIYGVHIIKEVIIMTLSKQLKTYITERFKLNYQETWACETVDAVAEDVLPEKYIKNSPLEHKILNTFTYYNDELHEISIYPFYVI